MVMKDIHSMNALVCGSVNSPAMTSHADIAFLRRQREPSGWRASAAPEVSPNPSGVYLARPRSGAIRRYPAIIRR